MSTCTCCPVHRDDVANVAKQAAADVRAELTRNGGTSTKEAAHFAVLSAEVAAAEAERASRLAGESSLDLMQERDQRPEHDPNRPGDIDDITGKSIDLGGEVIEELPSQRIDGRGRGFSVLGESEVLHVSPSLGELNVPTVGDVPPGGPGIGTAGGLPRVQT